MNETEINMTN